MRPRRARCAAGARSRRSRRDRPDRQRSRTPARSSRGAFVDCGMGSAALEQPRGSERCRAARCARRRSPAGRSRSRRTRRRSASCRAPLHRRHPASSQRVSRARRPRAAWPAGARELADARMLAARKTLDVQQQQVLQGVMPQAWTASSEKRSNADPKRNSDSASISAFVESEPGWALMERERRITGRVYITSSVFSRSALASSVTDAATEALGNIPQWLCRS